MIAFPSDRAGRWPLVAFVALVFAGVTAKAQVGPPIRLEPTAAPADTDHVPQGITADALKAPDPAAAGAIGAQDRAFPASLWQDTSMAVAMALLPKIATTGSPALNDLAFRLLASPATPPEGDSFTAAFIALRAERLANALGRADAAFSLIAALPSTQGNEAASQVAADLGFLSGNQTTACGVVASRRKDWQSPYWDQAAAACDALHGKRDDARLGLDMLRESKAKDDGFVSVVEIALGDQIKPPETIPTPQPIALALLQAAGASLTKHSLDTANLAVLRAIALGSGFPAEQRLEAAEKAAAAGALPPERLAEAYLALPFTEEDRDSPLNNAQAAGGAHGRAILFNAAHDAGEPLAKANMLVALFGSVKRTDLYFVVVRAAEPILVSLQPGPDLDTVAPDLARALYALDRPGDAAAWQAISDPSEAAALTPLAHVVSDKAAPPWPQGNLADLLKDAKDSSAGPQRALLTAELLAAEATPLPDMALLPLYDVKGPVPSAAAPMTMIEAAAGSHRLGATVLAVLAAVGGQGAAAPGMVLARSVAALREVGLGDEARHLAIDAAIAGGL